MESDVYGYVMILWFMATRQVEPFDPLKRERAFAEILSGKVVLIVYISESPLLSEAEPVCVCTPNTINPFGLGLTDSSTFLSEAMQGLILSLSSTFPILGLPEQTSDMCMLNNAHHYHGPLLYRLLSLVYAYACQTLLGIQASG